MHSVWSCREVPVPATRFSFLTRVPISLKHTPYKVVIARSHLTVYQADAVLDCAKGQFVDPCAPGGHGVAVPGEWSGPELVGEDQPHPARDCLPLIRTAFWLAERWGDEALA